MSSSTDGYPAGGALLFDLNYGEAELEPFCPPLSQFTKVRQLNITPLGLHGYLCTHRDGRKFSNHLPPNVQSVGIYTDAGDWVKRYFNNGLDEELEGVASAARLGAVVGDSTHAGTIDTQKLRAACGEKGIFYSQDGERYLFYCGTKTSWGDTNDGSPQGTQQGPISQRDPGRVIPRGMVVHDGRGRLYDY
jgi:hypothetical protein